MVLLKRSAPFIQRVLFTLLGMYVFLPIIAVILYSVATRWTAHILPDGYTLVHWISGVHAGRFVEAIARTFMLSFIVTMINILLVVPAVYWQRVRNPRIRFVLEIFAAVPFALPFIVIAYGILTFTDIFAPFMQGTLFLLISAVCAVAFPFLYWAVDGAMAAANIVELNDAAQTCGATPLQIFRCIVIPNISAGIASGGMLVFATAFNEFALVQLLIGNRFETVSLYSLDLIARTNADYNQLAVVTCINYAVIFVISVIGAQINYMPARGGTASLLPVGRA